VTARGIGRLTSSCLSLCVRLCMMCDHFECSSTETARSLGRVLIWSARIATCPLSRLCILQATLVQGFKALAKMQVKYYTRMVQLPAAAAIEYVAACWVSGAGGFLSGVFCPGGLLPGGTFVRGAYALSPQVQCIYEPSRLSVPSILAWRTNKKNKKDNLGPVAPRRVHPRSPNFQGM